MRFAYYAQERSKPVITFEVYPPKTEKGMANLGKLIPNLKALGPEMMTVTYGAMGTTQDKTLEIASRIQDEFGLPAAHHLTCVNASRDDMHGILAKIHDAGVRNIIALRGDPPSGEEEFTPPQDGFAHADELVRFINEFCDKEGRERFSIAVACYPEKHLQAPSMQSDLMYLKRKLDLGADCAVSQLFYDNDDWFAFVKQAREAGITKPLVPGLLPIASTRQIRMITSMCGARIPPALQVKLDKAGEDDTAALEVGIEQCIAQARGLLEYGVPGIHFYVLNRSANIKRIMDAIRPWIDGTAGAKAPAAKAAS